jgi:hypothetical protein
MGILTWKAPANNMTDYQIVPDGPHKFGVEVTSTNSFQSIRGFLTEIAALAWIEAHKAMEAITPVTKEC